MGSPQYNLSLGSPGKHKSYFRIKQTNSSLWMLSRPRSLVSATCPRETPEKQKTSKRPFDLAPSWEHFNQLTMKSLHFAYAGLYIKWLWSGWHFTASKIKDGNKCQVKLGWFWGFCSAFFPPPHPTPVFRDASLARPKWTDLRYW